MSSQYHVVGSEPSFTNELSTLFDGVNEYVNIGDLGTFPSDTAGIYSISCWIKTTSTSRLELIGGRNTSNQQAIMDIRINANSSLGVSAGRIGVNQTQNNSGGVKRLRGGTTNTSNFNNGSWHLLIITSNGATNTLQVVLDNVSQAISYSLQETPTVFTDNQHDLFIAAFANGASPINFYPGNIDEFMIHDHILSSGEMTSIWNSGAPTNAPLTGVAAFYKMGDGDTYPTITDNVGSNNGTMVNMSALNFVADVP